MSDLRMNKGCCTSLEIQEWALQKINWPLSQSQLVFNQFKIVHIILFQQEVALNGWSMDGRSWPQPAAALTNWCWAGCYRPRPAAPGRQRPQPWQRVLSWPLLAATVTIFPLAGRDPNILVTPDHIDGRPRPAAGCGYRPPMSCTDTQAICTFELKFCTLLIWQRAAQLIQCWESPFVGFPFVIKNQPQKRRAKRAVATNFCGKFCDGKNGPKYWDIRKMRLYYSIVSKYYGSLRSFYTCTHVCISN